jgi:hypothetical protein
MKYNIKLKKLFNLNNIFTLLLIVILILVIVCCVRKSKSNKENFLDWSPLTCDKDGKTDWKSDKHFGDVRCLDGEYGSAGAGNDDRAKALGGFLEFTAAKEQAGGKDLSDFTGKLSDQAGLTGISNQLFNEVVRHINFFVGSREKLLQPKYLDLFKNINNNIAENYSGTNKLTLSDSEIKKIVDKQKADKNNDIDDNGSKPLLTKFTEKKKIFVKWISDEIKNSTGMFTNVTVYNQYGWVPDTDKNGNDIMRPLTEVEWNAAQEEIKSGKRLIDNEIFSKYNITDTVLDDEIKKIFEDKIQLKVNHDKYVELEKE